MSTSSAVAVGNGAARHMSASPANDDDDTGSIPRLKVLYTFDNENKSNCLARLPNALPIPVVSLDEDTQVGVIDLKTCIQAIVTASPELIAKLGHDYTVYAYDFSEYETPLVGQGMLSWILASASATPNASAEDSQTMVTGRVCKNILGLFSNGIKETLEVKLKLVPVPSSMQKEYVENLERYHSLSQIMPEGFDYPAWSDFLKENPTLGQLAQPTPTRTPDTPSQHMHRSSTGGYEPFHQMLTRQRQSPSQEPVRNNSFQQRSYGSQASRASSPARSITTYRQTTYNHPEPRPSSRASVRSDMSTHSQQGQPEQQYELEFQGDGPPRKRARITQATRPRNTPLMARSGSLHKAAATASSAWLHRPIAVNGASNFADAEMQPRAPTPRPGDHAFGARQHRRAPAPSILRHGSMDSGRAYVSPYDAGAYSDAQAESGDDGREDSPDETPRDIPSSPPIVRHGTTPEPSSPTLPTFPQLTDSGFVSDVQSREEDRPRTGSTVPDAADTTAKHSARSAVHDATKRRKQLARMEVTPYDKSHKNWQEVNPGPVERLPQTYVPPPRSFSRNPYNKQVAQSIETDTCQAKSANMDASRANVPGLPRSQTLQEGSNANGTATKQRQPLNDSFRYPASGPTHPAGKAGSPDSMYSQGSPGSEAGSQIYSREATPNESFGKFKVTKSRGVQRSHTWSGNGEPMSDAVDASINDKELLPRSGGHAKRKKYIRDKLDEALASGELPDHCHNCGEIETPTWRKPYTRIMAGNPEGIELSRSGIVAYEILETEPEKSDEPLYRIYRQNISKEEKAANIYETMNLCNPCGLYLVKQGKSRPRSMWERNSKTARSRPRRVPSAQRKSPPPSHCGDNASDAPTPQTDAAGPDSQSAGTLPDCSQNDMPPPSTMPKSSSPMDTVTVTNEGTAHKGDASKNIDAMGKSGLAGQDKVAKKDDKCNNDGAAKADRIASRTHDSNRDEVPVTAAAEAALERAIQSSPAGFRRSQDPSADVDPDLTPKPTRRLLFPSPRKSGEIKSLDSTPAAPVGPSKSLDSAPVAPAPPAAPTSPAAPAPRIVQRPIPPQKLPPRCDRCRATKKSCDRKRPCGRCSHRGFGFDECIPVQHASTEYHPPPMALPADAPTGPARPITADVQKEIDSATVHVASDVQTDPDQSASAITDEGEVDKENCPPPSNKEDDGLAYLFETPRTTKTTPKKATPNEDDTFAEFLKTPTPGSRRRLPLTPRRGANDDNEAMTPSRSNFTPRITRSATTAPDTPFTRQLKAMLSDTNNSSPSQVFDFNAFPPFDTPARASGAQFSDLFNEEYMSSDMLMSSSPAKAGMMGTGFDLYEDPNTASTGMWDDSTMFSSDAIMADVDSEVKGGSDMTEVTGGTAMLKMTVGGITVDFASMIEEVVNTNDQDTDAVEMEQTSPEAVEAEPSPEVTKSRPVVDAASTQASPEATSQGLAQTPEVPDAD
ncbi:hypothetical protein E8E13_010884 [Curvularia kusanoi]|uniref:Zn(2)-C6 fungal-type domain-containing protein n=1 Tax=Curvularia kusanoi TaxID=90978 RepID=A0A9P4TNQ2_CURKU|nr:hypothetical protein E8E13_010884 [Curvularia kusanoi]